MSTVDDLVALMNPEPESLGISKVEGITDTEWLDGIHTLEEKADQYKVMVQCRRCAGWTLIEGDHEAHVTIGGYTRGKKCEHCGSSDFDSRSIISKRTFNPEIAKRRKLNSNK
jgi:hypothetical protein